MQGSFLFIVGNPSHTRHVLCRLLFCTSTHSHAIPTQVSDIVKFCLSPPEGKHILVLEGAAGAGKSALVANFCQKFKESEKQMHRDDMLMAHYVGCSSESTHLGHMLRRSVFIIRAHAHLRTQARTYNNNNNAHRHTQSKLISALHLLTKNNCLSPIDRHTFALNAGCAITWRVISFTPSNRF